MLTTTSIIVEGMLQASGLKLNVSKQNNSMQNYKDLEIYQISHNLAIQIHKMTAGRLPKFEMFEIGSQIRRAAKSIPALIVEGFGRKYYQQEYVKYLTYAIASCDETKEHLEILYETGSLIDEILFKELLEKYEGLGKKLYRFREAVKNGLYVER